MKTEIRFDLSAAALHGIAMACMLCDHLWATVVPGNDWLTCVGRLAYPIYAFLIVEGYFHTRDLKKYCLRLLAAALVSEVPFNLMYGGRVFYPVHQNVLWTFLLGLGLIAFVEWARGKSRWLGLLAAAASVAAGGLLGLVLMVDYNAPGVLTVLVFYFFRGRKWWCLLGQLAGLWYLNVEVLGGIYYPVELFGLHFELVRQSLALLALAPIWLYRGRQGLASRAFRNFRYAFYPAHMLVLHLLRSVIW